MHDVLLPSSRVTRLRNSFRLPRQAAVAARLPIAGKRVPMRWFWSRQPVQPRALVHELRMRGRLMRMAPTGADAKAVLASAEAAAIRARDQALPAMAPVAEAARHRASHAAAQAALVRHHVGVPRGLRGGWLRMAAVAVAAGLFVFYFDSVSGRRRRAVTRDKVSHVAHTAGRMPRRIERRGRFARGVARGVVHGTKTLVGANGRRAAADEETLVARVRSEVLRDERIAAGAINVDAYEGCVTLRGQLSNESDIRRLVAATKSVEGVLKVRSYLHLPDELPPNKAEMYEHSEQHLPSL